MTSADNEQTLMPLGQAPHVSHAVSLVSENRSVGPADDTGTALSLEVPTVFSAIGQEEEMPGRDVISESNVFTADVPLCARGATELAATLPRMSATREEHADDVNLDPLQSPSKVDPSDADTTLKGGLLEGIEEEIVPESMNARLAYRVETTPNASKRASHHRLDLKLSSPAPWELIGPPSDDGRKEANEFYTGYDSRKDNPMGNSTNVRSLIPKSSYYHGPPTGDTAFGTAPMGHIGVHHPREILRIERDYSGGEVIQFSPSYPLELEGRITPTQFLESINLINEVLISAHSLRHSFLDNALAVFTLQLSRLVFTSHYEREVRRLRHIIADLNTGLYNPVGLNILWPNDVAFLYLEIEYY
ncbi:hypothetical protein AX15_005678 [Amanita polypyramis BW_CC]|nr:hypothetical protein AX15_005678 [Amanita polypyramis BW_CC]